MDLWLKSHLKGFVRDVAAAGLWTSGLSRPTRAVSGTWTIVTFHRVLPATAKREYPFPELVVTPEELGFYVDFFRAHYQVVGLEEGRRRLQDGRMERPLLSVTFDDGQLDNYEHAAPELDARGCPATFFVTTHATDGNLPLWHDRVGFAAAALTRQAPSEAKRWFGQGLHAALERAKKLADAEREAWVSEVESLGGGARRPSWDGMMSWDQLRELRDRGHEIGSHTCTHPILPNCDDDMLERELVLSRKRLQDEALGDVTTLCYPNGDHDARVRRAAHDAGYTLAVTTDWGTNRSVDAPLALRRCDIQTSTGRARDGRMRSSLVALRLSGYQPGLTGRPPVY